jgi:hypothetical protein
MVLDFSYREPLCMEIDDRPVIVKRVNSKIMSLCMEIDERPFIGKRVKFKITF